MAVLIAFFAIVSLLAASARSTTNLGEITLKIALVAQRSGSGSSSANVPPPSPSPLERVEKKDTHVDRALAASPEMTEEMSGAGSRIERRAPSTSRRGLSGDSTSPPLGTELTRGTIASRSDMLANAMPSSDWIPSIERPTRDRARLMVFLN